MNTDKSTSQKPSNKTALDHAVHRVIKIDFEQRTGSSVFDVTTYVSLDVRAQLALAATPIDVKIQENPAKLFEELTERKDAGGTLKYGAKVVSVLDKNGEIQPGFQRLNKNNGSFYCAYFNTNGEYNDPSPGEAASQEYARDQSGELIQVRALHFKDGVEHAPSIGKPSMWHLWPNGHLKTQHYKIDGVYESPSDDVGAIIGYNDDATIERQIIFHGGIRKLAELYHPNGQVSQRKHFDKEGQPHDPDRFIEAIEVFDKEGLKISGRSFTNGQENFPPPPPKVGRSIDDEMKEPPRDLPDFLRRYAVAFDLA
ncbi:MAG: hypothetical protein AB8B83_02960 [Bdellovibrionales bacterium]